MEERKKPAEPSFVRRVIILNYLGAGLTFLTLVRMVAGVGREPAPKMVKKCGEG
ncbi:unnamed protein product, partial [Nesidiocoris tenuis]